MATSGYVTTNADTYAGVAYLRLDWYRTSYDSAAGINYVHWVLKGVKSTSGYYWARKFKVTSYNFVTGNSAELYYSANDIKLYNDTVIAEGDDYFTTNPDGTCSIQFNIEGAIYTYAVNCTGYDSWALDTVPRYANITSFSVSKRDLTSVKYNWTADVGCDYAWYSTNNGASWNALPTNNIVSGLSPKTTYNFKLRVRRTDSQLTTDSGTYSQTTYDIGRITSAPDFNDEGNPTINYTNEYGNNVTTLMACISYDGTANIAYRDITKTGTSYTFNLTEAERNILRNATTGPTRTVTFYIRTTVGDNTYYSTVEKTFSIVNGNPIFSSFNYEDIGGDSTLLTGDNQKVINNFNIVKITIPVANKATAVKGASMSRYVATCGNITDEKPYSATADVILQLPYIKNQAITVYAIDSREFSTPITTVITSSNWINYADPIISNASITRTNNVSIETTLSFTGEIWKTEELLEFGATENEITECYYQYKKTNETNYSSEINIAPTVDSLGNFSFSSTIIGDDVNGFNPANSYNIQITIKDKIRTINADLLLGAGIPEIAIAPRGSSVWRALQ